MNTESFNVIPELLGQSALRNLQDDKLRAKAVKVISERSNWRYTLIALPGFCLVSYFVQEILISSGLRLTHIEGAILFGLACILPAMLAQIAVMQRRLDAAIQLLKLNERVFGHSNT